MPVVRYTGAKASRDERAMAAWARRHNAQTGHETIVRLSYVYERKAAGTDRSRSARQGMGAYTPNLTEGIRPPEKE